MSKNISCNLNNNITCYNLVTQQNYIIAQFQTKAVRYLLTHLLQLLRAEATEKSWLTVTITQKTLKAKRYTLQSNPMHHSKKGSITTITSTKLTGNR